ncbi:hypothetical protein ACQ86F_32105 [Streptomyces venezuelae ATCC 10712]
MRATFEEQLVFSAALGRLTLTTPVMPEPAQLYRRFWRRMRALAAVVVRLIVFGTAPVTGVALSAIYAAESDSLCGSP